MSTAAILADACPVCPPGLPDASPPLSLEQVPAGIVTAHQCGLCDSAWSAFWRDGWVIDRLIAPVAPGDAEIHRGVLGHALAEQGRERRHAAA